MVLGEGTLRAGGGGSVHNVFHRGPRHLHDVNASTIGGSAQGVGAPLTKPPHPKVEYPKSIRPTEAQSLE